MAYEGYEWQDDEVITAERLNAIETGIEGASDEITSVVANTLEAGESATATLEGGVLTLGIPKGEKGDKGDTGAQGEAGADGTDGTNGADGADGKDGADGAAATITVGSVTSGDTASVTNSGTSTAAVFDFVLPKGDKGDTGEKGEQGEQGIQGEQGEKGDTGAQGAAGADGADGADGEDGLGVASITLTVTEGVVTAGTWTDTEGGSHDITIESGE